MNEDFRMNDSRDVPEIPPESHTAARCARVGTDVNDLTRSPLAGQPDRCACGLYRLSAEPAPLASSTLGIPRAQSGALQVLQSARPEGVASISNAVAAAADEISAYHQLDAAQRICVKHLQDALSAFLQTIVLCCPPGPERSTAISRAREAKMWGAVGIALEGK